MSRAGAAPAAADALLSEVAAIVRAAGERIMAIYRAGFSVEAKADRSPVTEADLASEGVILPALAALTPDIPVVSEEAAEAAGLPARGAARFWLVDPLDGTREFISRRDEFTVNVGLIVDGRPVLGVLGVPALDTLYGASGPGKAWVEEGGAARRPIAARLAPPEGLTVVASRSHGDPEQLDSFLAGRRVHARAGAGSALKFALVARGEADLYPRFGRTMEWDTAAGHAILLAAGGAVETVDGAPLGYGKPGFENPHFIAYGRRA